MWSGLDELRSVFRWGQKTCVVRSSGTTKFWSGGDGCCNSNLTQVFDGMDSSTHRLWLDRDEVEVGLLNQWVEWT